MTGAMRTCWGDVSPLMAAYHDEEWGVACRDAARLFEMLMLEAFQAGLNWELILKRRESFRTAFAGWDAARIARFEEPEIQLLLADAGVIRHRGKIEAAIANAAAFLEAEREPGGFAAFAWSFAPSAQSRAAPASWADVPASTPESAALSKALRRRGFRFVGPTTCYAFMQAVGMVNDHLAGCPRAVGTR